MKNFEIIEYLLRDEQVEFKIDGVYYSVHYDLIDNEVDFDSMTFYYLNEEMDSVFIPNTELNKFGFDLRFRYWLHGEIDSRVEFELMEQFYDEHPELRTKHSDYEYY
jgi:hypothetical protein